MFTQGDTTLLDHPKILAVVGSRNVPDAALLWARQTAQEAAESGWVIISGLARGCDLAGHLGCYKGQGRTIAAIATDFDHFYPPEHEKLQRRIGERDLLLSFTPKGQEAHAGRFVARNSLIARYAHAVLIPWADAKSGSRHVAQAAIRDGKPLFIGPDCPLHPWMGSQAIRVLSMAEIILPERPEPVPDLLDAFNFF